MCFKKKTFAISAVRVLLLFLIVCVVIVCGEKKKRDVHRIVIKEGRPLGHHGHNHHHHHHHHKPKRHSHHHHEEDRTRKNPTGRPKHRHASNKKITTTTTTPEPQEDHLFPQENKVSSFFTDEWTPILSKNNQILQNPQKYEFKGGRGSFLRRQTTPRPKLFHEMVDLTTDFPRKRQKPFHDKVKTKFARQSSESDESSGFLDEPVLETSSISKKKTKKKKPSKTKGSTPGYEVYEDVKEDVKIPHPSSFRLNPIFDGKFGSFSQTSSEEDGSFFASSAKDESFIRNHDSKKTKPKSKRTRHGPKRV